MPWTNFVTTAELAKQGEVIFDLRQKLREAEARCDEYVAHNMRQAQRLAALEAEAREVIHMLECDKVTGISLAAKKRLAEVLER